MGLDHGEGPATTSTVMDLLAFNSLDPSAIVGSLKAAHENAQGARDVISSEMWECLNATWFEVPARQVQGTRVGPHAFLRWVRERSALFAGLADSTMSRSDAWRFVVLGRSLERVDMTARLMSVRVAAGGHAPNWPTLLRAAGAEEAFLSAYGGNQTPGAIAEFLLRDRLFPRSAFHALLDAETCLAELGTGLSRSGIADPSQRIVGQMRTKLEYVDGSTLLSSLADLLDSISESCAQASLAIGGTYFGSIHSIQWEAEEG